MRLDIEDCLVDVEWGTLTATAGAVVGLRREGRRTTRCAPGSVTPDVGDGAVADSGRTGAATSASLVPCLSEPRSSADRSPTSPNRVTGPPTGPFAHNGRFFSPPVPSRTHEERLFLSSAMGV